MKKNNKKDVKIIAIIILIFLFLDQITKSILLKKEIAINASSTDNGYYIIMSMIIVVMILRYIFSENSFIKIETKIILSFAIAGALGNTIDRIWNKSVIVFIKISNSININLAYLYLIIAWIGMAFLLTKNSMKFLEDRKKKKIVEEEFEKNKDKIRGK